MIQKFVDKFMAAKTTMIEDFKVKRPEDYEGLFKAVVLLLADEDYGVPDADRITVIDDGDYQGTRVFVVAEKGCQPSRYWGCLVSYGSCSGCDTFQAIGGYSDEPVTDEQAKEYWDLCLHMVQNIRPLHAEFQETE